MNADKIPLAQAFETGSELWIVPDLQNQIWQDLDFRSGFLLSTCKAYQKTKASFKIDEIVQETLIEKKDFNSASESLLIGTEDHFFNRWILVVPQNNEKAAAEIAEVCDHLKVSSIRFFSAPKDLIKSVTARLSTSLNRISFVE